MSLDFEDYRPETPRVPSAISVREGILISLVVHLALALFLVLAPKHWFEVTPEQTAVVVPQEPMRYVQMMPAIDRTELAKRLAELSDQDRRSATRERAPRPENLQPLMRGNTPERTEAVPEMKAAGSESPVPPTPPAPPTPDQPALGAADTPIVNDAPRPPQRQANGQLGQAFRNLQQYLQNQSFNNPNGGGDDQSADIQFDSKGVDFGPWLRRFVAQIRRNWLIPQVAEMSKGRVVVQFTVLRSGMIVDVRVAAPAGIEALTLAALNAIKLSNPTSALPPEFPDDRAPFTVTFHYNEGPRDAP